MTDTLTRIKPEVIAVRPAFNRYLAGFLKRAFDLLASVLGLLFLFPVFCVLSILIKRESPGPVFYRGPRLGKDGEPFGILKFRTMYEHPDSYRGPRITADGDGRVTPLGHWLRATKINELPQLWNVLVGEMSLVGPRPEDPEIARSWPRAARQEILSVRPGITSPASVAYRDEEKLLNGASALDDYLKIVMPDKLRLDQLYVRNHRFLSDLDIIFWTLLVLLPQLRAHTIPAESLYNGLLNRFISRYFNWFVIDNLVAFAAVGTTGVLWRLSGPLDLGIAQAFLRAAVIALLFSLVNSRMGLGRIWWRSAKPALVFDLALSCGISTLFIVIFDAFWPSPQHMPLGMILVSGLLAFLGFVSVRYRERLLTGLATRWLHGREKQYLARERVLVVGAGECGLLANWLVQRSKLASSFAIIGMVDDDPAKTGMTVDGHHVFGLTHRIPEIVEQQNVDVILFAIETIRPEEQERILKLCRQTPARLVLIPDLFTLFQERISSAGDSFTDRTPEVHPDSEQAAEDFSRMRTQSLSEEDR
ncbi:MAG: sugar transferase [Anaerolineales bacterium]|nr:sugar transferase [Anaerolineales bacterium]